MVDVGIGGGGIPSNFFVSSELQLWLFCCLSCGCCLAVTILFAQEWSVNSLYFFKNFVFPDGRM